MPEDDASPTILSGKGMGEVIDGPLDQAWIDEHNKSVAKFRATYDPKVKAITREQAEAIVDLGLRRGMSMNQIAREMNGRLDFDVPLASDVAIGASLYRRALEMLDLHDADFRPRPERVVMRSIGGAEVAYHTADGEYEVNLDGRSERFSALHAPRFGMDVSDVARAEGIAAGLAAGFPPRP